jgi:uncharacterized protein
MRFRRSVMMIVLIMLMIDFYAFQAVRTVLHHASDKTRIIIYVVYWIISACTITVVLLFPYLNERKNFRMILLTVVIGLVLAKLVTVVFLLIDDIRRFIEWIVEMFAPRGEVTDAVKATGISRSSFMAKLGLLLGGTLYASLIYGLSNKYNYRIHRIKLSFDNLPQGFKGIKIIQISDIHSGSFTNYEKVAHGVEMILKENADIIFFTGDLVNDEYEEMKDYKELFSKVQAPMGVYATLGNHDYGDYKVWSSPEAKALNLEMLKQLEAEMGWKMLNNDHAILERGGDKIALIGVENWSALKRFPRHGDLKKAYEGTKVFPFKILLSHDPSHWDAQVRPDYPDIDLTLAGHTHGFQFGVEIPGFKWSPSEYIYKEWAGLYQQNKQYLYVNRGYGFIGYPGRVGILPEITVIELS